MRPAAPLRSRRRDLTIPLPLRDPSLAVPLPLPPLSAPTSGPSSSSPSPPLPQPPSSAPPSQPPYFLPDLDRLNRIGSGAGGTVYLVRHRPSSRLLALKVIYGNHDEHVLRQIRREIEILRSVNNPFVVRCYAMFDHAGEIQILLEYMDHGSLHGRHYASEPRLAEIASQILQGLAYLHRHKIVHRDIKPSNLLVDSSSRVKIADFGVSRILSQTMDPCNSSVGTIQYMSPERINTDLNEGNYDGCAADIWSFGISILELYLGKLPFERVGDWASLMCAICYSDPPTAPQSASPEFRSFISCCLQKEPGRRLTAARLLQHPFIMRQQVNTGAHQPLPLPPPLT